MIFRQEEEVRMERVDGRMPTLPIVFLRWNGCSRWPSRW